MTNFNIFLEELVKRADRAMKKEPFSESTQIGPLLGDLTDFVKQRLEQIGYKVERQAVIDPSRAGETPVYVLYVKR
ncbi:hypothetical protein FJZ19_04645 [Candidatus Pacearchaeota archaeon]|nr:hypothetical protein [Candidatus Pacearchaeota archaeon]